MTAVAISRTRRPTHSGARAGGSALVVVVSRAPAGYAARRMYGPQRRFLAVMAVFAALCCVPPLLLGAPDALLGCVPVLLIFGLLVCGRYVGEERILALQRAAPPAVRRRPPRRLARPVSERPLASLLARRAHLERGPPAPGLLTA